MKTPFNPPTENTLMKLRLIERPWESPSQKFAIEQDVGALHSMWVCLREFASEAQAKEFLALYAKGPRIIEQIDLAVFDGDRVSEPDEIGANALQERSDALQS